jgi:hypothetical protein
MMDILTLLYFQHLTLPTASSRIMYTCLQDGDMQPEAQTKIFLWWLNKFTCNKKPSTQQHAEIDRIRYYTAILSYHDSVFLVKACILFYYVVDISKFSENNTENQIFSRASKFPIQVIAWHCWTEKWEKVNEMVTKKIV